MSEELRIVPNLMFIVVLATRPIAAGDRCSTDALDAAASTATCLVVTTADAPLSGTGWRSCTVDLGSARSGMLFARD
jgi:hypothetical protein